MSALAFAPIILDAPYGKFYVCHVDTIDHAGMRAEQFREVLTLMSDADKQHLTLRLAKQLGGEVSDRTQSALADYTNSEGLGAASIFAGEVSGFLLTIELDGGADTLLWLARQLCDEVRDTLAGMAQARGVQCALPLTTSRPRRSARVASHKGSWLSPSRPPASRSNSRRRSGS